MDITIIAYVSNNANLLAQTLAEIFQQGSEFDLELITVDGGTMDVDFEKLSAHCREHGVDFSTVRQDPMNRIAPGFHVAATQARGKTLLFINPAISLPSDYLAIALHIGRTGHVVIPRAWVNIVSLSTECCGFWAPPDGCSLIMDRDLYSDDILGDISWSSAGWPKADAYFLATKISRAHPGRVGMAVVHGYEYRNWRTEEQSKRYASVLEHDEVDIHSWVLNEQDIRRYTALGIPFTSVTERVIEYSSSDDMSRRVRSIVAGLQQRHLHLLDPAKVATAVQDDLNDLLDKSFEAGQMIGKATHIDQELV